MEEKLIEEEYRHKDYGSILLGIMNKNDFYLLPDYPFEHSLEEMLWTKDKELLEKVNRYAYKCLTNLCEVIDLNLKTDTELSIDTVLNDSKFTLKVEKVDNSIFDEAVAELNEKYDGNAPECIKRLINLAKVQEFQYKLIYQGEVMAKHGQQKRK